MESDAKMQTPVAFSKLYATLSSIDCVDTNVEASLQNLINAYNKDILELQNQILLNQILVTLAGFKQRLEKPGDVFNQIIEMHEKCFPDLSRLPPFDTPDTDSDSNPSDDNSGRSMSKKRSNAPISTDRTKKVAAQLVQEGGETLPSFSSISFRYLDKLSPSKRLRNQLVRRRWHFPTDDAIEKYLTAQKNINLNHYLNKQQDIFRRVQHMLSMYKTGVPVTTVDEEGIVQPVFYAFLNQLCYTFPDVLHSDWLHNINGLTMHAWFPPDVGPDVKLQGKGDLSYGKDRMAEWRVLGELKAAFRKLTPQNVDQLLFQFYSVLNKMLGISSPAKLRAAMQDATNRIRKQNPGVLLSDYAQNNVPAVLDTAGMASPPIPTLNEFFGTDKDNNAYIVGFLSNINEIVFGFGSYQNGQYEFGFTPFAEAPSPRQFVLRLLHVMTLSPEELIQQAKTNRDQVEEAATKMSINKFDDTLNDDYQTSSDLKAIKAAGGGNYEDESGFDRRFVRYLKSLEVEDEEANEDIKAELYNYVINNLQYEFQVLNF